jgi:uncharacterized lipoprotein YajG
MRRTHFIWSLHFMTRLAALFTCFALAGCAAAQVTQSVDPGSEFTLAQGAVATVTAADVTVRFVAVTEDSRCPREVTCVWQGEVKAQLVVQVAQVESPVNILVGHDEVVGGYRVTLLRVEPGRVTDAPIAPQDYRVTLKVEKAG